MMRARRFRSAVVAPLPSWLALILAGMTASRSKGKPESMRQPSGSIHENRSAAAGAGQGEAETRAGDAERGYEPAAEVENGRRHGSAASDALSWADAAALLPDAPQVLLGGPRLAGGPGAGQDALRFIAGKECQHGPGG